MSSKCNSLSSRIARFHQSRNDKMLCAHNQIMQKNVKMIRKNRFLREVEMEVRKK